MECASRAGISALLVLTGACQGDELGPDRSPRRAAEHELSVVLAVDPLRGEAPLVVTADVGATVDPAGGRLSARWDFDGDGRFETGWSRTLQITVTYEDEAAPHLTVEVKNDEGLVGTASATVTVLASSAPRIDLDVDSDRDGVITADDDLAEELWSGAKGAVLISNFDDDDGDQRRDFRDTDVDGDGDLADLAPIVLRGVSGIEPSHQVRVAVGPPAAVARVRLFRATGTGPLLVADMGFGTTVVSAGELGGGVTFYLEAGGGPSREWNGELTVTATLLAGAVPLATDAVALRVAPVIFPDDTRPARKLYVMRIDDPMNGENRAFFGALQANVPDGVALHAADEYTYGADRWVQDNMQTGYTQAAGVNQPTYLQTERRTGMGGLEAFVPFELMRDSLGFAYPGGTETSLNYGGNLEVAPPHDGYPLGRLLIGGGREGTLVGQPYEDHMADDQRQWLDAQLVQGPAVELSTEWLAVGHIDEIIMVVPTPSRPGGWRIVIASPALARQRLEQLGATERALAVFAGRETQTTARDILADSDLMAFNQAAQARIDGIRARLMETLGIDDLAFVDVPVLYEPHWFDGWVFGAAYNPGVQNLISVGDVLFIPDPEGPSVGGEDVWQRLIVDAVEPLGLTAIFVDVFDSYHLMLGEAHCGANVEREPHATPWWEVL